MWDGNRQIQEYTDEQIFTTVYEQGSFEPVARVVQLSAELEKQRIDNAVTHVWQYVPSGIVTQDVLDNVEKAKQPLVKIYHYHNNHLGTPQELSDENGNIIWLSYDRAWGGSFDTIYKQQFIDNFALNKFELQPFKFQGQFFDSETNLHYNRFRYYDSDVGMFVQRDPIGLMGGSNVFQYAPNPVMWIDPFGLHFSSGKSTHTAKVTVHDSHGNVKSSSIYTSGNMTEAEKALGFPKSSLATHTEARAMKDLKPVLEKGDTVIIEGEYRACKSCKGKMNDVKEFFDNEVDIIYKSPEAEDWHAGRKRKKKTPKPKC